MNEMNFIFWRDFQALGEDAKILNENFDINDFKHILEG
jgi:hypothetical protein